MPCLVGLRLLSRPRLISSLAALALTLLARTADAQTVFVRSAPAGAAIELTMNGGAAVTATADTNGDATLAVPARPSQADGQLHVDSCGNLVRVLVVERGLQPTPAAAGCNRTDFPSTFVMRTVTSFVVDMADQNTQVHITQGPPPPEWVLRGAALERARIHWGTPSDGLVLSSGVGLSSFSNTTVVWCGSATTCEDSNPGGVVALGAEF